MAHPLDQIARNMLQNSTASIMPPKIKQMPKANTNLTPKTNPLSIVPPSGPTKGAAGSTKSPRLSQKNSQGQDADAPHFDEGGEYFPDESGRDIPPVGAKSARKPSISTGDSGRGMEPDPASLPPDPATSRNMRNQRNAKSGWAKRNAAPEAAPDGSPMPNANPPSKPTGGLKAPPESDMGGELGNAAESAPEALAAPTVADSVESAGLKALAAKFLPELLGTAGGIGLGVMASPSDAGDKGSEPFTQGLQDVADRSKAAADQSGNATALLQGRPQVRGGQDEALARAFLAHLKANGGQARNQ